jgi:hypothetical protein
MLLGMHIGDADKADMVARYGKAAVEAGRDPHAVEHVAAGIALVGADARRELRAAMPQWLRAGLAAHTPVDDRPPPARDPVAYTEFLCSIHPVGPAARCADRLLATAERTGIRHFILMVEGAGTAERTLANIDRIGTELLPLLHD